MDHPFAITTRKDQRTAGRTRYFTGKPCLRGHVAQRFVTSGGCVECQETKQGSLTKTRRAFDRYRAEFGLKDRFLMAHDDDWPVLEALAADMAAERERVYIETVRIPEARARAGTIAEQRTAAAGAHTNARLAEIEARELSAFARRGY